MSNVEERFKNWRDKMNSKSEKERHNFALTVSFLLGAIVLFFVASSWYFKISGDSFETSFFTDIEEAYNAQKESFSKKSEELGASKDELLETLSGAKIIVNSSTTQATTSAATSSISQ